MLGEGVGYEHGLPLTDRLRLSKRIYLTSCIDGLATAVGKIGT
jgi:hypothetical protein